MITPPPRRSQNQRAPCPHSWNPCLLLSEPVRHPDPYSYPYPPPLLPLLEPCTFSALPQDFVLGTNSVRYTTTCIDSWRPAEHPMNYYPSVILRITVFCLMLHSEADKIFSSCQYIWANLSLSLQILHNIVLAVLL